ncbi:hypothetical protein [Aquimarina sp. RZ0]|uniref:hypothetical protein n=1 Tax=Aquimarina sp. RZ0 TaxID=2607730 RepID=UPI0011F29227|nr:hypothetical protein [Aquimarina sp. RZ0]KAA1244251.1 hypothetical protein F0000_17165 [Aquimarina sp. RZ0]
MKKQGLFYSLFALAIFGAAGLTQFENSRVADVVTVASSPTLSDEGNEKREEGLEALESIGEYNEATISL